ncbi:MAG: lysophospholipid acyltransferase family protein [Anaerotardibacter sp.]
MSQKQEELWAKSLGGNNTDNEMGHAIPHFLSGLFRFLCKVVFSYDVKNIDIIRGLKGKEHGAVLVGPHTSYLDPVFMFIAVRPYHWVHLVGKESLFSVANGVLGWIVSRIGAIPVKRDSADRAMVKNASRMLKNGELVGIFPEGTRRGKGDVSCNLHGGAALIARMGKAPLVPVGLTNVSRVKEKGKRLRLPKITVTFGEPIDLAEFNFLPKDERLDGCVWYVMRESFALTNGCAAQEVDMAELFPENKDYTAIFEEHPIKTVDIDSLPTYEQALVRMEAKKAAKKESKQEVEQESEKEAKDTQ